MTTMPNKSSKLWRIMAGKTKKEFWMRSNKGEIWRWLKLSQFDEMLKNLGMRFLAWGMDSIEVLYCFIIDSEYREYISRIVLRDYDNEIDKVQTDIDRVRFP